MAFLMRWGGTRSQATGQGSDTRLGPLSRKFWGSGALGNGNGKVPLGRETCQRKKGCLLKGYNVQDRSHRHATSATALRRAPGFLIKWSTIAILKFLVGIFKGEGLGGVVFSLCNDHTNYVVFPNNGCWATVILFGPPSDLWGWHGYLCLRGQTEAQTSKSLS